MISSPYQRGLLLLTKIWPSNLLYKFKSKFRQHLSKKYRLLLVILDFRCFLEVLRKIWYHMLCKIDKLNLWNFLIIFNLIYLTNMLQGDFNHMANIITVLFEQIIAKNIEKVNASQTRDSRMSKSNFLVSFVLNVRRLGDEQSGPNIFFNNEVTKYDFFETVYQITNVLGQTNPCLISSLIMIDRFSVKNPNFTITQDNIQRYDAILYSL